MGKLLELLEGYCLGSLEEEDERMRLLNRERGFLVKFLYFVLSIAPL